MKPALSRPANKAKPNTRFLRNIIKGTEHHNKTLLAKEHAEAQARLREHATAEEEKRRKYRPTAEEMRGRQLGNIAALLQGRQHGEKRKRGAAAEGDVDTATELQRARAAEDARRLADMAAARKRQQRDKDGRRKRSLERYSARRDADDDDEQSRRANTSSDDESRGAEDRKRRHRSRSPRSSPRKHRYRSPPRDKREGKSTGDRTERARHHRSEPTGRYSRHRRDDEEDADSDPLEDLIGPAPPARVLPRGRGAIGGSSGMDSRFSSDYDPKSDVQINDVKGHNDWDDALEAMRDRARFKQQGADRLREAGFTEEQVKKWEKGDEKTIDDVRWTKAGEKREWDRGKDAKHENGD